MSWSASNTIEHPPGVLTITQIRGGTGTGNALVSYHRIFKESTRGWHRAHTLAQGLTYQRTTEEGHLFAKDGQVQIIPEIDTDPLTVNRPFLISQGFWPSP